MNDRSFYSDSIPSNINKPVGLDGFVAFLEGNMVLRLLFQLFIISLMSKWKFLVIHLRSHVISLQSHVFRLWSQFFGLRSQFFGLWSQFFGLQF